MAKKLKSPSRPKGQENQNILILRTEQTPVKGLRLYHKNPRIGNVPEIAKSLHINGQFKPIIVNIGTLTGRKNEILAGNHTYKAARTELTWDNEDDETYSKPEWDSIYASFVDVDEERATSIVLADNKTSDDGTYDDAILAELFNSLPEVDGTGYSTSEVDDILATLGKEMDETLANTPELDEDVDEDEDSEEGPLGKTFQRSELGEEDEDDPRDSDNELDEDDDEYDETISPGERIESASEELEGLVDLKEELPEGNEQFYSPGYWQLPALRGDQLMHPEEVSPELIAWAGSATKDDDDPDRWWLYNWGIDSTSGMQQDKSQVIVGFYCWDQYFENWFWHPKKFTTKLLNSGIKYALTPNYSQWPTQSRFLNLWALYRARYVGRYLQEAGIKIVPDINWPMGDIDFLEKYVLKTLPKKLPMISLQMQTFDVKEVAAQQESMIEAYQKVIDHCKPEMILFYAGKPGNEWFKKHIKYEGKVFRIEPRMKALAEKASKREKKKGI